MNDKFCLINKVQHRFTTIFRSSDDDGRIRFPMARFDHQGRTQLTRLNFIPDSDNILSLTSCDNGADEKLTAAG